MSDVKSRRQSVDRLVILIVIIGLAGVVLFWFRSGVDPEQLLEDGLALDGRDSSESERLFRRAIAAKGGQFPDANLALCSLLAKRGYWTDVANRFAAADKNEARSDLLLTFGERAHKSGRYAMAIEALEVVRERNDVQSDAALMELLGIYQETGRQAELIESLWDAARRKPGDFRRWSSLIQDLKATFRNSECLEAAREALQHNPPPEIRSQLEYALVEQLVALGDREQARQELLKLEDSGKPSIGLQILKVDVDRLDGRLDDALATVTKIFPQVKDMSAAYLARGAIFFDLGEYEKAAKDFGRLLEMEPYNERAHFKLSEAYRLLGKQDLAVEHRLIADQIRERKRRLNSLLKEHSEAPSSDTREQIATLYESLGETSAAQFWRNPPKGQ